MVFRLFLLVYLAWSVTGRLVTVPSINFASKQGSLSVDKLTTIVVDQQYASWVDQTGLTLVPPTLDDFASTFSSDLSSALSRSVPKSQASSAKAGAIFLTINPNGNYYDVAGRFTAEGYTINVTSNGVVISGASSLGAWWGTRTLMQMIVVGNTSIPLGSAVDAPGWSVRGAMMDVARKYFPPDFIIQICAHLSYFKQNELHLHLSDDGTTLFSDPSDWYANNNSAFRLLSTDSAVAGLDDRKNESYTYDIFDNMQRQCAARGVTIIPEIDTPGHSLAITRWRPELALSSDATLLDLNNPQTLPVVESIWNTFLSWFHTKTVHMGADEYTADDVDLYNDYVNTLNGYIHNTSQKNTRIWGTYPPKSTYHNITTNVTIHHWASYSDNPLFDYIKNGYKVINSDLLTYVDTFENAYFPTVLNKTFIFKGGPNGEPFYPWVFSNTNVTNNAAPNEPLLLGNIHTVWNDDPWSVTTWQTYFAWRDALPALADKQWNGNLTESEYDSVFQALHDSIPAMHLDQSIPTKTDVILQYNFVSTNGTKVTDLSGNGYHGINHGCALNNSVVTFDGNCTIETPLYRKGLNYSYSFDIYPLTSDIANLISNNETSLTTGNGTVHNLTLITEGYAHHLNYSLPVNTWTTLKVSSDSVHTYVQINNATNTTQFNTKEAYWAWNWGPIYSTAPLTTLGKGFKGRMRNLLVKTS